jgi:hypothetical protein
MWSVIHQGFVGIGGGEEDVFAVVAGPFDDVVEGVAVVVVLVDAEVVEDVGPADGRELAVADGVDGEFVVDSAQGHVGPSQRPGGS